jgi:hypothetical protein
MRGGEAPGQDVHVRVTAVTPPFFVANPNEDLWMCVVPINDYQCVHFHVFFHPERRMNEESLRSNMLKHVGLDEEALRNYNMTYDTVAAPGAPDRRNHFLNRKWLKEGRNPFDHLAGLDRLVMPALYPSQQHIRIRPKLLQGLAVNAGCYTARGPDADRRARSLIRLVQAGSRNDADSQTARVARYSYSSKRMGIE